jgi:hypothetical protein
MKNNSIARFSTTTKNGNTLSFFYNPGNDLLVIDIISADESGGNEIVRETLDEKVLLGHVNCPVNA